MGMIRWGVVMVLLASGAAWADEAHVHGADSVGEQTLTGEVVDVLCYLSEGERGLGKGHAACARKCIAQGLPVALKVGDQLYLLAMADHQAANATLGPRAADQVTVTGRVLEQDGQHLIAVSHVE